jgi:hypothetical protein
MNWYDQLNAPATAEFGTERTNWVGLLMSGDWGRPVVAG